MPASDWTPLGRKRTLRDERRHVVEPLLAAALSGPDAVRDVAARIMPSMDWGRVLAICHAQGVAAVVLDALERAGRVDTADSHEGSACDAKFTSTSLPGWPAHDVVAATRRHHVLTMMQQRPLERMLGRLLAAFDEAGVRVVALKGPLLAERLWGSRERRVCSDLDLLVTLSDVPAASAILARHGYAQHSPRITALSRWRFPDIKFVPTDSCPVGAPLVELHWIAAYGFGTRLDTQRLLARALPYRDKESGSRAWVLEPHDEFLALAIHGAKHQFERLTWLVDLAYLLTASQQPLSLDRLWRRARAVGAARVVAYAAHELARLGIDLVALTQHATPPTKPRALVSRRPGLLVALATKFADRIHALGDYRVPTKLWRIAFNLLLAQNTCRRARYVGERTAAALSRVVR